MAIAEKTKTAETPQPQPAANKGAVVALQPPRLPYHPAIEERFGLDKSSWKALVEAVYPLAGSVDSVILALSYCKARKLDPFKRPVHIVPIYDKERRKMVDTIWPGIAEHRTTAFRTGHYAGADPANFGPMMERTFTGEGREGQIKAEVRFPEWCQITVYRMVDGQRVPMPGPHVYWLETYSRIGRTDVPNDMWQKRPSGQLEKCAEAAALRKAFPEEIGDELTADEAGTLHASETARDITPDRPTRESVRQTMEAEHTAETKPQAEDPEVVGLALVNNDGEIIYAGGDGQEFVRLFCAEMEAISKDAARLSGLWESNEPELQKMSEVVGGVARKKYAALTGKMV